MNNELRPCVVVFKGTCPWKYEPGLFHRWCEPQHRFNTDNKKIKLVALVELKTGSVIEVKPEDMWFIDTEKQMAKFPGLNNIEAEVLKMQKLAELAESEALNNG